jgi:hypothetical protein
MWDLLAGMWPVFKLNFPKNLLILHDVDCWNGYTNRSPFFVLAKISGYMHRPVQEAIEIKLQPDNINRGEGFKLSKAWIPSTGLLRHSNTHTSRKSKEDTEKIIQKREKKTV